MDAIRIRSLGDGRRAFLRKLGTLAAAMAACRPALATTEGNPETIAAIGYAFQRETDAHLRYVAFAQAASQEGYKGIAYMFTAFATSEGLHARNFKRLVAQLGGDANAAPTAITPGMRETSMPPRCQISVRVAPGSTTCTYTPLPAASACSSSGSPRASS